MSDLSVKTKNAPKKFNKTIQKLRWKLLSVQWKICHIAANFSNKKNKTKFEAWGSQRKTALKSYKGAQSFQENRDNQSKT